MNKSKKLVYRTAKLLSDARRSKIDAGVAISYEHQPSDLDEKKHGSLFAIIEIAGPTNSSQEIVELIIDNFHSEYYKDLDRDPLESFESALAKINEELTDITEQGKIHWLGKLNAILGVISNKTLHLSQAGGAEAHLFRKSVMSHISKDLAGDNINPLRTFINIASGEISEDDKIGFFSPGIFYTLSKEEIRKYITGFNPNTAISHLKKIIQDIDHQKRSAAIIIEVLTPETLANYTIDEDPDEVWITETKNGLDAFTKGVSPVVLTAGKKTVGFLAVASAFIKMSLIPYIATFGKTASEFMKSKKDSIKSKSEEENVFIQPKEAISMERFRGEDFNEESFNLEDEIKRDTELKEDQKPLTERPERTSLVYSTFNKFSSSVKKTGNIIHLPKNTNSKKLLIIVVLSFLFLGTVVSISGRIKNRKADTNSDKFEQALSKYDEANNFLILNDKEKAAVLFAEARTLAEDLKGKKAMREKSEELLAKITEKENKARGIEDFNGELFADLEKVEATGLLGLQKIGDSFYSINSNTGSVYEIKKDGAVKTLIEKTTFDGKPIAATAIEENGRIVIMTNTPSLYEFNLKSNEIFKLKVTGKLEKGKAIAVFGSNIYVLSPEEKAIYKHIKITGGYGERSNYIKKADNSNVAQGISLAIDGNIYVLSKDGVITKFSSGVQQNFSISGLPEKADESSFIYTSDDSEGFFIVNKNKKSVMVVDKDLNFTKQFLSDNFKDLKGLYADKNNLYILSGTKIYKSAR